MKLLISIAILFSFPTFAASKKKREPAAQLEPTMFWTKGYSRGLQSALPKGGRYRVFTRKDQHRGMRADGFLPQRERAELFRKTGVEKHTAKMDEMDRDVLVIRAREYDFKLFRKNYPNFTEGQLRALQREARKIK